MLNSLRIAIVLLIGVCFAGCGGGGGNSAPVVNPLVGAWAIRSLQLPGGTVQQCPGAIKDGSGTVVDACGANDTIVFHADGTYVNRLNRVGTWSSSGSMLSYHTPQASTASFSITGSILILTDSVTSAAITLQKL